MYSTEAVARKTLEILPLVMRVMAAEIRQPGHTASYNHLPLLGMLQLRPHTLSELAERSSVSAPTMSSTINTLEERGWVTRERDMKDRRLVWIAITPAGHQVVSEVNDHVAARIAKLISPLSAEERRMLVDGLTVLRDTFAAAVEGDPQLNE